MSLHVCLLAQTFNYLEGGGHFWAYLNWALGLRANDCDVTWLETVDGRSGDPAAVAGKLARLRGYLQPFGLDARIGLLMEEDASVPAEVAEGCATFEACRSADLLVNFRYGLPPRYVKAFRRSALVDIDPGLLQYWVARGELQLASHDVYFTIGEQIGAPGSPGARLGIEWIPTRRSVSLDQWPVVGTTADAAFTTISHWYANEFVHEGRAWIDNSKRAGFLPYLELPSRVRTPLELALCLDRDDVEAARLRSKGWSLRNAGEVSDPEAYRRYVQASAGEFTTAKPAYVRFANAWLSDRTVCFLASGKPAIVEHTGTSDVLPDRAGLWRFRDFDEAVLMIESVRDDYARQCQIARELAVEHFDARKVARRLLEVAVP